MSLKHNFSMIFWNIVSLSQCNLTAHVTEQGHDCDEWSITRGPGHDVNHVWLVATLLGLFVPRLSPQVTLATSMRQLVKTGPVDLLLEKFLIIEWSRNLKLC